MQKRVLIFPLVFLIIFGYAYFLEMFFVNYLWLFFGIFVYFVFFIANDSMSKQKALDEKLRVKDRREIRIDFWK